MLAHPILDLSFGGHLELAAGQHPSSLAMTLALAFPVVEGIRRCEPPLQLSTECEHSPGPAADLSTIYCLFLASGEAWQAPRVLPLCLSHSCTLSSMWRELYKCIKNGSQDYIRGSVRSRQVCPCSCGLSQEQRGPPQEGGQGLYSLCDFATGTLALSLHQRAADTSQ